MNLARLGASGIHNSILKGVYKCIVTLKSSYLYVLDKLRLIFSCLECVAFDPARDKVLAELSDETLIPY